MTQCFEMLQHEGLACSRFSFKPSDTSVQTQNLLALDKLLCPPKLTLLHCSAQGKEKRCHISSNLPARPCFPGFIYYVGACARNCGCRDEVGSPALGRVTTCLGQPEEQRNTHPVGGLASCNKGGLVPAKTVTAVHCFVYPHNSMVISI